MKTYSFEPSKLTDSGQKAHAAAMDRFWDTVKSRKDVLLPCLRAQLLAARSDAFIRVDGSALLVSLDSSRTNKQLQIDANTDADLHNVDHQEWIGVLSTRALEGFDITKAGDRWLRLSDSAARYFLPEHGAYEVSRNDGALFLYGALPESLATPALVAIVATPGHPGREIGLWLLTLQATPAARTALSQADLTGISSDGQRAVHAYLSAKRSGTTSMKPRLTRANFVSAFKAMKTGDDAPFMALVDSVPHGERDAAVVLEPEDLNLVRWARRRFISAGTPEVIEYYSDFTGIIEAVERKGAGH